MATRTLLSLAEFMALPENGMRQELVDGTVEEIGPGGPLTLPELFGSGEMPVAALFAL